MQSLQPMQVRTFCISVKYFVSMHEHGTRKGGHCGVIIALPRSCVCSKVRFDCGTVGKKSVICDGLSLRLLLSATDSGGG